MVFVIMFRHLSILVILLLIVVDFSHGGIFSWMFKGYESHDNVNKQDELKLTLNNGYETNVDPPFDQLTTVIPMDMGSQVPNEEFDGPLAKIPFELASADEKFLKEIAKYVTPDISELDVCHHKVIIGLQSSCSELSEEEISKIAVNLLNCQSFVEKRRIYPCTQEMFLHECTKDMDSDTWNSYHIVSNRVRAVCYHFRQQQFRAKTEMTVNKLMLSAEEQINSMKILENSQNLLKDATSETLENLKVGHGEIKKQQNQLFSANANIQSYVSSNLRELAREKRLITSGQKELSRITLSIKKKLEDAQEQLKLQGDGQRETHQKIIQDLAEIQESASKVWEQLDLSTQKILLTHEQTVSHYAELLDDLHKMNSTVQHLTDVLVKMRQKVEEKFSWISSLVGDTDTTVQKIYSFVLHICYGLLGMVAASFLQVPYTTRMALIILVPLNALAEMKNNTGLNFSTLTVILASCMFFNVSAVGIVKVYHWRKKKVRPSKIVPPQQTSLLKLPSTSVICSSPQESGSNLEISTNKFVHRNEDSMDTSSDSHQSHLNESKTFKNDYLNDNDKENFIKKPANNFLNSSIDRRDFPSLNSSSLRKYNLSPYLKSTDQSFRERSNNHQLFPVDENDTSFMTDSPRYSDTIFNGNSSSHFDKSFRTRLNHSLDRSRSSTPLRERRNSFTRSLTPKTLCCAISKTGLPCKNTVSSETSFCHRHINSSRESTPY